MNSPWHAWRCAVVCSAAALFSTEPAKSADVFAEPGEAGLRAAITAAEAGDTVVLKSHVDLLSTVRIDKRLTLRSDRGNPNSGGIRGAFEGELFRLAADGIVFDGLSLGGTPLTDGLHLEKDVILRDCTLSWLRKPVTSDSGFAPDVKLRLERVTVTFNEDGLEVTDLEAKDCTFSFNGRNPLVHGATGAGVARGFLEGCRFESNFGFGLYIGFGTVKDCTFRYNTGFGLWCDADPGDLSLSGSLFYANGDGGLMVGEQVYAEIENCTFTRHTGTAAILIGGDSSGAFFRHCTISDNAFFASEPMPRQRYGRGAFTIDQPVTLQNCLVADNPTDGSAHGASIAGSWIDGGGNVIGGPAPLNVLGNNGGRTLSMLPMAGSAAIGAGVPSRLLVDARGFARPAGGAPDAGAIEADATPVADDDRDGLPNHWEQFHRLDKDNPADALSDADQDGGTALAEFRSHTDPNDPLSVLRFEPISLWKDFPGGDTWTAFLVWPSATGIYYEVETSTDLREWRRAPMWAHPYSRVSGRNTSYISVPADSPTTFFRVSARQSVFE